MILDYLKENIEITNLSNFKIKAFTKYYFEVNDIGDVLKLKDINLFCKKNNISLLYIGGGTNLLFAFDVYEGVVVKNNLRGWNYDEKTMILSSFSDEPITDIAKDLEVFYNQNLWHRFIGLPGSIGGAIYGNAGCFGLETENNFLEAEIFDIETGQMLNFNKEEMKFDYRYSIIKELNNRYFIISARFDLSNLIEKYHSDVDNINFRENKQPKGNTCGSFFKNHSKDQSAGFLIEQVGLKGFKLGGAFFSALHANFLMNDGNATYRDLLDLINLAQSRVKNDFGIDLIPEVRIITN